MGKASSFIHVSDRSPFRTGTGGIVVWNSSGFIHALIGIPSKSAKRQQLYTCSSWHTVRIGKASSFIHILRPGVRWTHLLAALLQMVRPPCGAQGVLHQVQLHAEEGGRRETTGWHMRSWLTWQVQVHAEEGDTRQMTGWHMRSWLTWQVQVQAEE